MREEAKPKEEVEQKEEEEALSIECRGGMKIIGRGQKGKGLRRENTRGAEPKQLLGEGGKGTWKAAKAPVPARRAQAIERVRSEIS